MKYMEEKNQAKTNDGHKVKLVVVTCAKHLNL
jgi:hypothetical protein